MASIIIEDIIAGQRLNETADELTLNRIFKVQTDAALGTSGIIQARFTNGIPSVGDVHPTESSLFVKSIDVAPLGNDSSLWQVTCNYTQPNASEKVADDDAPAQISIGTTTTTYRTDKDRDDKQMLFIPADGTGSDIVKSWKPQTFIADVPRVLGTFRLVRKETTQPGPKAMEYTNHVNSTEFLSLAAGLVYCNSIQGESSDGGDTYTVTYTFTADPLGWDVRGVYTIDGEPAPDVDSDGNPNDPSELVHWGLEDTFDVLDEIDFNLLNLQ